MTYRWEEWGVLLSAGTVALCATRDVAQAYPHGWPAVRAVSCTPVDHGRAHVDIGPWVPLRSAA
jgi:hypothetical protein